MKYQIRYQLGTVGTKHRTLWGAVGAYKRSVRAARAGGDQQAVRIEHADGSPLTACEDHAVEIELAQSGRTK